MYSALWCGGRTGVWVTGGLIPPPALKTWLGIIVGGAPVLARKVRTLSGQSPLCIPDQCCPVGTREPRSPVTRAVCFLVAAFKKSEECIFFMF